jgi:serine/threonine protein kinase
MADIQAGTVIDAKYRILDVLGRGGMGIVYRAEQLDIEGQPMREVALKMLLAGSFPDPRLFRWLYNRKLDHLQLSYSYLHQAAYT